MDESASIRLARGGDLDAFNRLVLSYQDMAYNLAFRLMGDDAAAQDATQTAFISAFQSIHTFRGDAFRAWLMRIITNACYDELRRLKRRPTEPLTPFRAEDNQENEEPAWLDDGSEPPESRIERLELERIIQRCLGSLPDEFKTVVVLVDVEGMDYKEASQIVRKPLGTIRSRLARARQRVQDCLQQSAELLPEKYRLKGESLS